MNIEELREHYFFQLRRRQDMVGALSLPVAVLTGLLGLVAFLLRGLLSSDGFVWWGLLIAIALGSVAMLGGFVFIVRSFFRKSYEEIGDLQSWGKHLESLREYSESHPDALNDYRRYYDKELAAEYARLSDRNQDENIRRAGDLYWAKVLLAIAASILGAATIPYTILRNDADGRVRQAEASSAPEAAAEQGE